MVKTRMETSPKLLDALRDRIQDWLEGRKVPRQDAGRAETVPWFWPRSSLSAGTSRTLTFAIFLHLPMTLAPEMVASVAPRIIGPLMQSPHTGDKK
jgi:hypothetical protein